jgi:hypothetical protein
MQINNSGLNFDNTNRVHILAECMDIVGTWDKAPSGKEKQLYSIGDKIESLDTDTFKTGTIGIIKQLHVDNGYYHYYAGGVWHRQKDIKKV